MQRVEIHKEEERDFPGGPESACQCRGHRFDLWSGKIAHTAGQLSFCATPLSPHILKPVLGIGRGTAVRSLCITARTQPLVASTRESLSAAMKTQGNQKKKKMYIYTYIYKQIEEEGVLSLSLELGCPH